MAPIEVPPMSFHSMANMFRQRGAFLVKASREYQDTQMAEEAQKIEELIPPATKIEERVAFVNEHHHKYANFILNHLGSENTLATLNALELKMALEINRDATAAQIAEVDELLGRISTNADVQHVDVITCPVVSDSYVEAHRRCAAVNVDTVAYQQPLVKLELPVKCVPPLIAYRTKTLSSEPWLLPNGYHPGPARDTNICADSCVVQRHNKTSVWFNYTLKFSRVIEDPTFQYLVRRMNPDAVHSELIALVCDGCDAASVVRIRLKDIPSFKTKISTDVPDPYLLRRAPHRVAFTVPWQPQLLGLDVHRLRSIDYGEMEDRLA